MADAKASKGSTAAAAAAVPASAPISAKAAAAAKATSTQELEQEIWFHGVLSRRQTVALLQGKPRGTWLARYSSAKVESFFF
jgi:hypothetical protein